MVFEKEQREVREFYSHNLHNLPYPSSLKRERDERGKFIKKNILALSCKLQRKKEIFERIVRNSKVNNIQDYIAKIDKVSICE